LGFIQFIEKYYFEKMHVKVLLTLLFQENCVFRIKRGRKYFVLAELKGKYLKLFINFG
jgi:hypothetical protein